jgi:hypothetical protein
MGLDTAVIKIFPLLPADATAGIAVGDESQSVGIGGITRWLALAVVAVAAASYSAFVSLLLAGIERADLAQPAVLDQVSMVTKFLLKFDLGGEQTVAAWLSSMLMLLCALVLIQIATTTRRISHAYRRHWLILGFIFLGLSMDEAVGFHEMTINPMRALFDTGGVFLYAWVIPALGFVALVGTAYLGFLLHLQPAVRNRFLIAGALFVGGAIGFEMLEGAAAGFYAAHPLIYETAVHLEDSCEFAGILLFLNTLLRHLQHCTREVTIRLV